MSVAWKGLHVLPTSPTTEKKPTRVCVVVDDPFYDEEPSDNEETEDEGVLYEDRYLKLSNKFLTLKCYYFPSGKEKKVSIFSIESIERREDVLTPWGTVDAKVWWCYDYLRDRRQQTDCYFVLNCREKFLKGFTCKRPFSFWIHLSKLRSDLTRNQDPPKRHSRCSTKVSSSLSEDSLVIDCVTE